MTQKTVTLPAGFAAAAYHALVSYAYGNAAPALAKHIAEEIRPHLSDPTGTAELSPLERREAIRALRNMADELERNR